MGNYLNVTVGQTETDTAVALLGETPRPHCLPNACEESDLWVLNGDIKNLSRLVNTLNDYKFEGIGFYTYGADANLGTDVQRFFNPSTQAHFYTTNPTEQAYVQSLGFVFEGVAFEAS